MNFLSTSMLGLICQYNSSDRFGAIRPQNRMNQLSERLQSVCARISQSGKGTADRKELVRELREVNSELLRTQYQDQSGRLQDRQWDLLRQMEKKKWEQYRRDNNAPALTSASLSKLVSASGKYGTYGRSGGVVTVSDPREWRESGSRASGAVEGDLEDSRTLGIMAADAARSRKGQKARSEVREERENRLKDKQHANSAAYLQVEQQRRKRKKVIDAYI